jgi:dipeptidase E
MRLLLISNSTNAGEKYLEHPIEDIRDFLGNSRLEALFVPYAGVTITYDEYEKKVKERFNAIGHDIISIHHFEDPIEAVNKSGAIVVGGGNTFRLSELLWKHRLVQKIRERVLKGTPYIGWSAGANIACPTIGTTNDMPIAEPKTFNSLDLVKFQINPHYLDAHPEGHAGETREMRINEYIELNREVFVAGLREGSMLLLDNGSLKLRGSRTMRVFKYGFPSVELGPEDDPGFML